MDTSLFHLLYSFAHRSPLFDALIVFFASYFPVLLFIAFFAFIFFIGSSSRQRLLLFLGFLLSGIIARGILVSAIRFFYHRPRPFLVFDINPLFTPAGFSFPSGHASLFFALSFFLFFFSRKAGLLALCASLFLGVFRIISGVHYPFDILGGIFFGFLSAYLAYRLLPSASVFSKKEDRQIT